MTMLYDSAMKKDQNDYMMVGVINMYIHQLKSDNGEDIYIMVRGARIA